MGGQETEKLKRKTGPEVEVLEWEDEDIEKIETQDALEKFIEAELSSLTRRAEDIFVLGQKILGEGLADTSAEIDKSDEDYQIIQRWMERIKSVPKEARDKIKKFSAEQREEGWAERRVGFGDFELVVSAYGDFKPDSPLRINFEDKEGNKILDVRDLLPGGVQIKIGKVPLRHLYDEERDEIHFGLSKETVEEWPKEIFVLLHEAGHAWQSRSIPYLVEKRKAAQRGASPKELEKFFRGQGSREMIKEERGAWYQALQLVSAVRQAKGVDLLSSYGSWEEAKERMLVYFGTHEYNFLAQRGDKELKDLFQETLGTHEEDLKVFEDEVQREAENIMAEIRAALNNLYDDFLKRREIKPSMHLERDDFKKIVVQARAYSADIIWLLGQDLDERIFNTGRPETVRKYIDSIKNRGIVWRARVRVLDRKMGKVIAKMSSGLAAKWAEV